MVNLRHPSHPHSSSSNRVLWISNQSMSSSRPAGLAEHRSMISDRHTAGTAADIGDNGDRFKMEKLRNACGILDDHAIGGLKLSDVTAPVGCPGLLPRCAGRAMR